MGISLLSRFVSQERKEAISCLLYATAGLISEFLLEHSDASPCFLFSISYCGAQIFEIYGLGQDIVDLAFCGSVSYIGGLSIDEVNVKVIQIITFCFLFSFFFLF